MSAELPELSFQQFHERLARASSVAVGEETVRTLHLHYLELRRWNRSLSLVGPSAAADIVERHYAEALEALPLIPSGSRTLVDVGSGAGFPGAVLAAALPGVEAVLVEPRERRWAFLEAACRRASLPCRCLGARVVSPLPEGLPGRIDVVTMRALKLPPEALGALAERLAPRGRVLIWAGGEPPELPSGLVIGGERPVPGSDRRRILEARPA